MEGAISPACNDTNGSDEDDSAAEAFAIDGIPPEVALAKDERSVYTAPGFLPELASHPLQRTLGRGVRPAREPGRRCRERARITGTLERRSPLQDSLRVGDTGIGLHRATTYTGPTRAGLPYLVGGEHIAARGRFCDARRVSFIADELVASVGD